MARRNKSGPVGLLGMENNTFFGGEVQEWQMPDLVECESEEQIKARKERAKLKKKYPNQPELWDESYLQDPGENDDLLNDLPF